MSNNRIHTGNKVSLISLGANVGLAAIKAIAGILGNSSAMMADSVHSLSDSISTIAVIIGLRIGNQPPDNDHHYGHARAETIAAKFIALFLIATAIGVGYSSYRTLVFAPKQPERLALIVALISIVVKEFMYRYTSSMGEKINSNALIADAWHQRSDALSSVTAFFGIAGARLGFPYLDPIAGILVAVMVMRTGVKLYWESIEELVDTAPPQKILNEVIDVVNSTPGVLEINEIKGRSYGPYVFIDLKICVNRFITVQEGHDIAHLTSECVKEIKHVEEVLIHVNPCGEVTSKDDNDPNCEDCDRHTVSEFRM